MPERSGIESAMSSAACDRLRHASGWSAAKSGARMTAAPGPIALRSKPAFALALHAGYGPGTTHASSFSRGISSSEACQIPLTTSEGAERRQARGCSGTRSAGRDAGPQARRDAPCVPRRPLSQRGDARLSALHRGGFRPPGPLAKRGRCHGLALRSSNWRIHASALSGGGRCSGASRESACKATRRTPHPGLPMRCLATSTLGGWD